MLIIEDVLIGLGMMGFLLVMNLSYIRKSINTKKVIRIAILLTIVLSFGTKRYMLYQGDVRSVKLEDFESLMPMPLEEMEVGYRSYYVSRKGNIFVPNQYMYYEDCDWYRLRTTYYRALTPTIAENLYDELLKNISMSQMTFLDEKAIIYYNQLFILEGNEVFIVRLEADEVKDIFLKPEVQEIIYDKLIGQ